ncbi:MAG: class I SAM-dependent methyltransferase [bacterium]
MKINEEKEKILQRVNQFYWYHVLDLGNQIVTDGDYDIRPLLPYYGIPEDLQGKTVLDVGRGSGFFSFEFERRGADVTATDLSSFFDWDFVGGDAERNYRIAKASSESEYNKRYHHGAFDLAKELLHSNVKSVLVNVYNMTRAMFEGKQFDLVFMGSLMSHLKHPILALERLYDVTRERVIISAPTFNSKEKMPMMTLVGTADNDRRSWWVPNPVCLAEMLRCVGFKEIKPYGKFTLKNRRQPDLEVSHIVVHGFK